LFDHLVCACRPEKYGNSERFDSSEIDEFGRLRDEKKPSMQTFLRSLLTGN